MNATKDQSISRERRKWLFLMIAPLASLFIVAFAQIVVAFVLSGSETFYEEGTTSQDVVRMVINVVSFLVGIIAVVMLVLFPIWLVKYLTVGKPNRSKTTAIVLAIIFGFWTWLYTYEKDSTKFWVNFSLTLVTFGYWGIIGWVWAIIDATSKSDDFYNHYSANLAEQK